MAAADTTNGAKTMTKFSEITADQRKEMQALVNSGDLSLKNTKAVYLKSTGNKTSLTDDQLLTVHAAIDDDYGDEYTVKVMQALESGEKEVPEYKGTSDTTVEISEDVKTAMELFTKDKGRLPSLAPEQIQEILDNAPEDGLSASELIAEMMTAESAEESASKADDASPVTQSEYQQTIARINDLAKKIDNSDAFTSELSEGIKAKDRLSTGPVQLALILCHKDKDGKDVGVFSVDEMAGLPDVGTTKEDVKGTNRPFDIFYAPLKGGQKKGDRISFWEKIALTTTKGKELNDRYEALVKASKKAEGFDPKLLQQFKTADDLEAEVNSARNRVNYYKGQIKAARQIWENMTAISQFPHVNVKIRMTKIDDHDVVRKGKEPICVFTDGYEQYANFTWNSFVSLKPGEAKTQTYDALIETLQRNTDNDTVSAVPAIKNVEQWEVVLATEAAFAEESKTEVLLTDRVAKAMKQNDKAFILSLGKVAMLYDTVFNGVVQQRYMQYRKEEAAAEKKEKASKAA
jgi:hypothetical protein